MHQIPFLIADNQAITRAGVQRFLTLLWPGCGPAQEVADKASLVRTLLSHPDPIAVVLDYTLFDFKSLDDWLITATRFPQVHWLVFSAELSEGILRRLGAEPRFSLLLKECSESDILAALQAVSRQERFICPQISTLLHSSPEEKAASFGLTPTETEILRLIALGKSVKEIASLRYSSVHTITTHKKNIFRKLEVNNVHEATRYALRAGLVEMMEYYI